MNKKFAALFLVLILVGIGYFKTRQTQQTQPNTPVNPEISQRYLEYSSENLAKATDNNGKTVLFFAALRWCPTCQAADKDFRANFDKLPKNVSILMVDYDLATELKNKYSITYQDTLVQVDG